MQNKPGAAIGSPFFNAHLQATTSRIRKHRSHLPLVAVRAIKLAEKIF
jgi:hypothetical protein